MPILAHTREDLAAAIEDSRLRSGSVGLVPTMGSLHEGHLSLVDRCVELSDATVVSIFVNPLQFGPAEDLDAYPRDLDRDLELCAERGVDVVFAPPVEVVYPSGEPDVWVVPGPMGDRLCGAHRPGHFRGVLTVVAKLFGLVRPELAVFGRKDLQQTVLISRMVDDLELGVRVVAAPTIREPDGLAMSSRNGYLSKSERAAASGLFEALNAARRRFQAGERSASAILAEVRDRISMHPPLRAEYVEAVSPRDLGAIEWAGDETVVAVAAYCGTTRLIDNMVLGGDDGSNGRPDSGADR